MTGEVTTGTKRKHPTSAVIGIIAVAAGLAVFLTPSQAISAQSEAGIASPPSSEIASPVVGPYASLPNYLASALTLRHWHQPIVEFYVDPTGEDTRTPEEVRARVAQGIGLWQDKIGTKLTLQFTDDVRAADVEIRFVPNGALSDGRIGVTDVDYTDPENDITHATIRIVEGLPGSELIQAVAHESGHALGIQGHSEDKHDLMYACIHLPAIVSDRDANTLNAGYYTIDTSKKPREFQRGQKYGTVTCY